MIAPKNSILYQYSDVSCPKEVILLAQSSAKVDKEFLEASKKLGQIIANKNLKLVATATTSGIYGEAIKAVIDAKGDVTGILPFDNEIENLGSIKEFIKKDIKNFKENYPDVNIKKVSFKNTFKASENTHAAILFPSGMGALKKFFDLIINKLYNHKNDFDIENYKIIIFNLNNYWENLIKQLDDMYIKKFQHYKPSHFFEVANTFEELEVILEDISTNAKELGTCEAQKNCLKI